MDTSGLTAVTSAGAAAQAQQQAGIDVLKMATDAEQQVSLELIQAISLPIPGLGENFDAQA